MSSGDHGASELSDTELRVRALESLLTEKGYLDPATVDAIAETYESRIGPRNGAMVVAKAWSDDDFAAWLREDASAATQSIGFGGRAGLLVEMWLRLKVEGTAGHVAQGLSLILFSTSERVTASPSPSSARCQASMASG